MLKSGEQLTDKFVAEIIVQKLQSETVQYYGKCYVIFLHYFMANTLGYVLDCLPSMCEEWKPIVEQINFVKLQNPTVIINLRVRFIVVIILWYNPF